MTTVKRANRCATTAFRCVCASGDRARRWCGVRGASNERWSAERSELRLDFVEVDDDGAQVIAEL